MITLVTYSTTYDSEMVLFMCIQLNIHQNLAYGHDFLMHSMHEFRPMQAEIQPKLAYNETS